ncbi:MAG: formate--phosphoribosylaminoimidazolecarboxamide ligase family protein [Candidatus Thermoplasmatota archaeon]|nr:formate--phosphoribosylaminoimidazolecarboxamide ligase family protein [Candidatus Thermoplasmatota archaeon]MBU1914175.1 formate--phosphoribosylaminoimidazolecarboxamide ligase family protein [Candidatus Thermoplasmatota archaeon]
MIAREKIFEIVDRYDLSKAKIGMVASHSALDVCDGAVEEGFRTVGVCQEGRDKTYSKYFKCQRDKNGKAIRGVVDEMWTLKKFNAMMDEKFQALLKRDNVLFVPNRSFTSYVDLTEIENNFAVPLVGTRGLLRSEERGMDRDYYWILEKAGLPFPKKIEDPKDIDGLVIVKLHHKVKKLERGFFSAASYQEFREKSRALIFQNVITEEDLASARIEEYVIGPVFNLDFFYSPLENMMERIELLGVDWRFETSLDGHVRLPANQQITLQGQQAIPEYTVCGHNSATMRESLLENAFSLAEKYVKATQEHYSPGIIGPFCLQTCVDKDLKFHIYDVAPRVGGGTNVHMWVGHPYGNTTWRTNMSTGRRLAMEVRRAIDTDDINKIVT